MMIIKVDEEIELRAVQQKDYKMVYDTVDQNRSHLRRWLPWVDYMKRADDYIEIIEAWQEIIDNGTGLQLGIFYRGEFMGMCGYNEIVSLSSRGQIGYWLTKNAQGRGIASRSISRLVSYGFDTLKLNRIEIICGVHNYRSRALPEAMGFVEEGVLADYEFLYDHFHDCIMYRQLKKEYEEARF
ncbi:GNAT family N-acetyltransferase [Salinicoccus sesuvii]|uniref:GNAT family N-acetyltransferase n=1 Tax=Salinicoccus sesuvii TaxID=868281 RepID=A0ABV7N7Y2_9STAP